MGDNVPCALYNNNIQFSKKLAIRDDSRNRWESLSVNTIGSNNGWGNAACEYVCSCYNDVDSPMPGALVVDCSDEDWGSDFPTNLPATTTRLLMEGPTTNLKYMCVHSANVVSICIRVHAHAVLISTLDKSVLLCN